jgi:hypothetical protein
VPWEVEFTDEFEGWWDDRSEDEQEKIRAGVNALREFGPNLTFPSSSGVKSRHAHMRELRIQIHGRPYRVFYAFDPRRMAILLLGGDKTGQDRWYEVNVPRAEKIYDDFLLELAREETAARRIGQRGDRSTYEERTELWLRTSES